MLNNLRGYVSLIVVNKFNNNMSKFKKENEKAELMKSFANAKSSENVSDNVKYVALYNIQLRYHLGFFIGSSHGYLPK